MRIKFKKSHIQLNAPTSPVIIDGQVTNFWCIKDLENNYVLWHSRNSNRNIAVSGNKKYIKWLVYHMYYGEIVLCDTLY